MKGMRPFLNTILTALTLYSFNNSSTRAIACFLWGTQGIKVSHVTTASWTNKFAQFFKNKSDKFRESLYLNSDDWHADETVVFINGERYYLWLTIDPKTRFILAFHLAKSRSEEAAFSLINQAKEFGLPSNFITNRLPSYNQATKLLSNTKRVPVKPISNNLIETFKALYKANNLVSIFIFHYTSQVL